VLRGRTCYGALDLSGKHDLTALVLAFPDDAHEPSFDLVPFFWTPEGQLGGRPPAEQERLREWIRLGHMAAIPGPTIRFSYVARQLVELSREFDIAALGYDRWRIDDFRQDLADVDASFPAPLEPFGQGFKDMTPAVEWFAELALTGRLRHGGHPVLTAAVAGAITVTDAAGGIKVDKGKSNRGPVRIDGAVAAVMALGLRTDPRARRGWRDAAAGLCRSGAPEPILGRQAPAARPCVFLPAGEGHCAHPACATPGHRPRDHRRPPH
jgi:phage terminase large subunit-like protein